MQAWVALEFYGSRLSDGETIFRRLFHDYLNIIPANSHEIFVKYQIVVLYLTRSSLEFEINQKGKEEKEKSGNRNEISWISITDWSLFVFP